MDLNISFEQVYEISMCSRIFIWVIYPSGDESTPSFLGVMGSNLNVCTKFFFRVSENSFISFQRQSLFVH